MDYSPRCVRLLLCGGDEEGLQEEREKVGLRAERVDSSPVVEHNSLTQKIKQKSRKIVMDAEKGEFYLSEIEKIRRRDGGEGLRLPTNEILVIWTKTIISFVGAFRCLSYLFDLTLFYCLEKVYFSIYSNMCILIINTQYVENFLQERQRWR